jgi:succinate-semialdehyde dehydrogenase / glutarate-semialdehyde dehydrogenase
MIVLPDAPLDRAAQSIVQSAFSNAGQLCMSIERIYVHRDVFDDFLAKAVDTVNRLTLGVGLHYEFDVGSLISTQQLERVSAHVDDAVARGATVHAGGKHRPDIGPYVFEPTVITGVDESMALCREETFGPVIALYPVDSDAEAVMKANDSDYGLNASVWGSVSRATPVAHQIEAGSVNINEGFTATWTSHDAPMGGFKRSGLGRRHGREGITRFTESRTVSTQRLITIDRPRTMSNRDFAQLMIRGLRLLRHLP